MTNMEKRCPTCGKNLKAEARFCTACGTDVQNIIPTQTEDEFDQVKEAASDAAGLAWNWIKESVEGVTFMHFIPLITTIIGIFCLTTVDWLKNTYAEISYSLEDFIVMATMWGDISAELVSSIFAIGTIIAAVGAVFLILQKTFGKVLYCIGAGVTLVAAVGLAVLFIASNPYFFESSMAYYERTNELLYCPQIGYILFMAVSVAGLVFAAKSDT